MDISKRNGMTVLGLAALVAFAAGSRRPRPSMWDAGAVTVTTATAVTSASSAPEPADLPDPTTDYKALDDAKLDGAKAYGKTILLRVWRGSTEATNVTLYACGKLGAGGFLQAKYTVEQRPLVKSIPTTIPIQGHCPRVVLKLTGKQDYSSDFKGELQTIMDVLPAEEPKLPAGVDYVSMDDITIDGKKAAGKVAQVKVYRGDTEEKKFTAYPCKAAGLHFITVSFAPEQKEAVKGLSSTPMSCESVKVKLTKQDFMGTWTAQLLDVVKD
jgi:hypothetical protein